MLGADFFGGGGLNAVNPANARIDSLTGRGLPSTGTGYERASFALTDHVYAPAESYNPVRGMPVTPLSVAYPGAPLASGGVGAPHVPIAGLLGLVAVLFVVELVRQKVHIA